MVDEVFGESNEARCRRCVFCDAVGLQERVILHPLRSRRCICDGRIKARRCICDGRVKAATAPVAVLVLVRTVTQIQNGTEQIRSGGDAEQADWNHYVLACWVGRVDGAVRIRLNLVDIQNEVENIHERRHHGEDGVPIPIVNGRDGAVAAADCRIGRRSVILIQRRRQVPNSQHQVNDSAYQKHNQRHVDICGQLVGAGSIAVTIAIGSARGRCGVSAKRFVGGVGVDIDVGYSVAFSTQIPGC
mmetsp:Transcript_15708/g.43393  ORF Transcript_15708/g.43393 Transcript_15708/m.43393 type:complete len:245 (+) Transcript_15708:1708-2442(+)